MKQLIWFVLLVVLVVPTGIGSAQSGDPVILQIAVNNFLEDVVQTAIDDYQEQNPNVVVQLVTTQGFGIPAPTDDAEAYQDDLVDYFQSADLVLVDNNLNSEATRAGYVLDLTPLTQSDPNYNEGDFHQTMLDAFKWDFGQWALPVSSSFITLSYSTEAFDAAGLNYPNANWTLDDLIFAAETLTQFDADGSISVPGLVLLGGDSLDYLLRSALGQPVYDEMAFPLVPDYSNPAIAPLLERWLDFVEEGYTTLPDGVEFTDVPIQIRNPQFGNAGGSQNQVTIDATALLPGGTAGMDVLGIAISSGTSYPAEAYDLANFLVRNPNITALSGGVAPAFVNPSTNEAAEEAAIFIQDVNEAFAPLLDTAIANGISQADLLFASGLGDALDLMQRDGVSAEDALQTVFDEQMERLTVADNRATTTTISVNPPRPLTTLSAGEIALEFAVMIGGGPGGANVIPTWEALAEEFVAQDPEVALINVDQAPPLPQALSEDVDCYFSSGNMVGDLDLSTVLSLDPLLFSDPNFDPNDFVPGVLQQAQVEGVTYALPLSITPLIIRIDPVAFEQAGVPIPQGSWTVSEFEDAMRQLTTVVDEDTAPFAITGATPMVNLIAIYGGQPFDLSTDPITLNFTDPATVAAVQQVLTLVDEGLISYDGSLFGFGGGGSDSPIREQLLTGDTFGFAPGGGDAEFVTTTFPTGAQGNAVAFDLGTMYISTNSDTPQACYRFMSYVAQSADVFDSMPVRMSLLNSSRLVSAQGQQRVDFYNAIAQLLAQPDTLILPTNIDIVGLGMTQWFTAVFDNYLAGNVVDLQAELEDAERRTADYMACVDQIDFNFEDSNFQDIQDRIQACIDAANS